jgi:hypothetical protein
VNRASTDEGFKRTERNDPHGSKRSIVPDRDQGSLWPHTYFDFGTEVRFDRRRSKAAKRMVSGRQPALLQMLLSS